MLYTQCNYVRVVFVLLHLFDASHSSHILYVFSSLPAGEHSHFTMNSTSLFTFEAKVWRCVFVLYLGRHRSQRAFARIPKSSYLHVIVLFGGERAHYPPPPSPQKKMRSDGIWLHGLWQVKADECGTWMQLKRYGVSSAQKWWISMPKFWIHIIPMHASDLHSNRSFIRYTCSCYIPLAPLPAAAPLPLYSHAS